MVARGGMCGCSCGGACMVVPRGGMCGFFWGHVWLLLGGMCGFFWGGGMHGFFWGGVHGFFQGVCMVFSGGACVAFSGGACVGYDEIRSMSGRYASYWNAFLCFSISFTQ